MPTQNLQSALNSQAWSKLVITRLDQVNVFMSCGAINHNYEGEIKNAGDTVQVRTFGDVTVSPYTRGQKLDMTALAPTKQPLTINDAQAWFFSVDDLDEAQNDIDALKGYASRAAVKISNTVDAKASSYYAKALAANQIGAGSAITISATTAYTTLVDAQAKLDQQNVPSEGRWAVIGPTYKSFLLKDTTYLIRATQMGDAIVRLGVAGVPKTASKLPNFIGQIAGFNLFMSNVLPSDSNGYYAQYGGPGVISYAGQLRKVEQIRPYDTFATAMKGLLLHDATVFTEHAKAFGTILTTAA